ncbi:MAG: ExbD/TolR family protein [Planctomycetota bacterium]|jgi:biopolymer transport protein ExbD
MALLKGNEDFEGKGGPNLTSLIDMLFLLIVFFIVTSVFVQEEIDHQVQLPVSKQSQSLTRPKSALIINLRQDGTIVMGTTPLTAKELEVKLAAIYQDTPGRSVVLRGDSRTVLQKCVHVMDILKRVGFAKFTMDCRK